MEAPLVLEMMSELRIFTPMLHDIEGDEADEGYMGRNRDMSEAAHREMVSLMRLHVELARRK